MRKMPSLTGLRAFESAARCGSFVRAGEELGVSSAAVSLQVRGLEDHLGKMLFERQGNRIFLTDAGTELFPRLAHAFDEIADVTGRLQQSRKPRQLVVSVIPSLADCWLMPRISEFSAQTGAILDVCVREDPIDFVKEGVDVRLTYQSSYYAGLREKILFSDVAIPVCSQAFWREYGDPDGKLINVPHERLVQINWGPSYASSPSWQDWYRQAGRRQTGAVTSGMITSDLSVAIAAARNGAGVALVPSTFVELHLREGALIKPSPISIAMVRPYVCVFPEIRADYSMLVRFLETLGVAGNGP